MHSEKGIAVSAEFCRTESPVLFHSLLQRNYVKVLLAALTVNYSV